MTKTGRKQSMTRRQGTGRNAASKKAKARDGLCGVKMVDVVRGMNVLGSVVRKSAEAGGEHPIDVLIGLGLMTLKDLHDFNRIEDLESRAREDFAGLRRDYRKALDPKIAARASLLVLERQLLQQYRPALAARLERRGTRQHRRLK